MINKMIRYFEMLGESLFYNCINLKYLDLSQLTGKISSGSCRELVSLNILLIGANATGANSNAIGNTSCKICWEVPYSSENSTRWTGYFAYQGYYPSGFEGMRVYYYSETKPSSYYGWHYVNGVAEVW